MSTRARAWAAGLVVVLASVVFVAVLARAVLYAPTDEIAAPPGQTTETPALPGEYPARLRIPSIGVDAKVQRVGLTKSGAMGTPSNFTDVGWYKYGPVPGRMGSAVIDGHVDNALGLAGVFKNLDKVSVGDDLYVDTASSTPLRFLVVGVESYPYTAVPTERIFKSADAVRLNLITCEGKWISRDQTYDGRLVVYAVLVRSSR